MSLKTVFFGSSDFAVPSLEFLLNSQHEVLLVVTQPDRKKGREMKPEETPVKKLALSRGIKVYQPETLKDQKAVDYIKAVSPEAFVVVSFGQFLPQEVLEIPELYSINLHPSLLPKYRGAAPINWAIMNGEKTTGITVIRMNERMDAGDIMLQKKVLIEKDDTALTLGRRLSELGAILILDALRFGEKGKIKFKKQPKKSINLARKLTKEDGLIDWNKDAEAIRNLVRGLDPWPSAFTYLDGKMLKIWKCETLPSYEKKEPGTIVDVRGDALIVSCGKGLFSIKEMQGEGGKRMDAASFLRGHKVEKGVILGKQDEK